MSWTTLSSNSATSPSTTLRRSWRPTKLPWPAVDDDAADAGARRSAAGTEQQEGDRARGGRLGGVAARCREGGRGRGSSGHADSQGTATAENLADCWELPVNHWRLLPSRFTASPQTGGLRMAERQPNSRGTMPDLALFAFDIVAITVLAYGVYFRRHRRRDMLLAYAGLNIGVMSVSLRAREQRRRPRPRARAVRRAVDHPAPLVGAQPGGGRLLLRRAWRWACWPACSPTRPGSLRCSAPCSWRRCTWPTTPGCSPATAARWSPSTRRTPTSGELTRRLEELLGAEVRQVVVTQVDLVRDLTIVDVRYRLLAPSASSSALDAGRHEALA